MEIVKLSLKEQIRRTRIENSLAECDPSISFLYRGKIYSVSYFYDTYFRFFWKAIGENKEKLKLREIPLYDGDVIIYGVTNVNKFIDFLIEYSVRFICNIRGKEQGYIWDMYVMCYPQELLEKLHFYFHNMFTYYDFMLHGPYIRFYVPRTDDERLDIILRNTVAGILNYVVGVSEGEFGKKNIIIAR